MHKRKSIRLRNEFLVKNSVHFAAEIHVRHVYPTILFIMPGFVQIPIIKWWIDGRTINFHVHEEQYTFLSASSYSPIFARRKRRVIKKKKERKEKSVTPFCVGFVLQLILQRLIITRSNPSRNEKPKKRFADYPLCSRL